MESNAHLVLVDDEANALQMYTIILRKEGYLVHEFLSGMDAISFLKFTDKRIELIITDLNMPYMDGLTFIKQIRKLPEYKATPFIILTAVNDNLFQLDALQYGAIDYISKPIQNDLFLAKVQSIVRSYRRNALNQNILLRGDQTMFSLEEIIEYSEQERVSGYAFVNHLNEHGMITFEKGVLKEIRFGKSKDTAAFEKMKSWNQYKFLIIRGAYNPETPYFL